MKKSDVIAALSNAVKTFEENNETLDDYYNSLKWETPLFKQVVLKYINEQYNDTEVLKYLLKKEKENEGL